MSRRIQKDKIPLSDSEEATSGEGKEEGKEDELPWMDNQSGDQQSRKKSVSGVEDSEYQRKISALEREVQTLSSEKEAAISEKEEATKKIIEEQEKKATEAQTQLSLVKQQTELTLQAKTLELQGKDFTIRSLETDIQVLKRSLAEVKKIVEEQEKKATEAQTQLNLVKQQTGLTLQAKTLELQGKDVTIRSLETDIKDQKRSLAEVNESLAKEEQMNVKLKDDLRQSEEQARFQQRDLEKQLADLNEEHRRALQDQQVTDLLTQQVREDHKKELAEMTGRIRDLEEEVGRVKGEHEGACQEFQALNKELLKELAMLKEKREDENRLADEQDKDWKLKLEDLQNKYQQMEIELEQEKVRGQENVRDLEDKLMEKEETVETLRVGLEKEKQLQMEKKGSLVPQDTARQVTYSMQKQGADTSPGHSAQHTKLTDPEGKFKYHDVCSEAMVASGEDKSPHSSLPEEKSPYSSLNEVKMVVKEDYMTDADKLDLQEMLKQSQEELEELWNHNKILVERVRVLEECNVEVTGNISPEPGHLYISTVEEKMQLLEKLEERDNQLKVLREEKLEKGEESTTNYPDVMRSLSVGDAQSPADSRAEVDRLRGVVEDREKIHNLQVHEDNSELVQALRKENDSIRERMKILEQEKQAIEDEKGIWDNEISAEKENREGLQAQVARLTVALSFYESRYPHSDSGENASEMKPSDQRELSRKLHKADVAEFRNTISRKESVIKNMQTQRCTMERRMARLEEERDRLAEQNLTLLAIKENLRVQATQLHQKEMLVKVTEVEGLTKEKEMKMQEIKDLQHEIEAWKVEATLTKEDFEKERTDRENMASRLDDLEEWKDREQDYKDEIHHLKSNLNHLTYESGQRELQLTAKLEHSIKRAREMEQNFVKLQEETDMQCGELRDERDLAKEECQRVGKQLREVHQSSGLEIKHLKSTLGDLEQQSKHDMADRNRLIADTEKLSDELISVNKELTLFKAQAKDDSDKDELSQYELSEVKNVPNSPFSGRGCYGSVTLVRVNEGAKCIEKRLHDILTGYGQHEQVGEQQKGDIEKKFREECLYLSRLRHPNVVQFIGVRYTSDNRLSLIMEFLPATVKGCIERCNKDDFTIPISAKLAILRDVTYGLIHLHSLSIAHRDLSAANILLTSDLRAKIADLGMSKLLTPAELRRLTKAPGAADIMPPEALQKDCKYTCQIDIFSFGVLSLYLMLQEYPDVCDRWITPQNVSDKEMEVGKRMGYIQKVPLCQHMIRCCLQDIPERRPRASELKEELETMCERNSPQHGDTVQMLQTIRRLELELTAAKETAPQPQAASHVGGQPYHQPRPGQQYHRYHSDSPYDNQGCSRYPPH